jgi:Tol biopolymer transport system component
MRAHRRQQIEALFEQALDRPRGERSAWLEEACRGDDALREDVQRLLAAHEREAGILEQPVRSLAAGLPTESVAEPVEGRRVDVYRLVEEIGRGGMGVVYKAHDPRLDRFVALKFLPPHWSRDERAKARFITEAKAASALDHPNICTVYNLGESEEGRLFMAMSCYEGETLAEKLERGPLSVEACVDVAVQIGRGLERAHEAGIMHRDVKPANMMVTDRGEVKILDFGVAKLVDDTDQTRAAAAMGTVAYMSPEQARGEPTDARTDLWSLGVVMYEMLVGAQPFGGDTEKATLDAILYTKPDPIRSVRADVPDELALVVEKLLRKDPDARYQDASEMLAELERLRGTQAALNNGDLGLAGIALNGRARRWGVGAVIAAVSLLAVFGAALYQVLPRGNEASNPRWNIRPLTGSVAYELSSTWSPDGSRIAFSKIAGSADIYVMSRDGGPRVQLTDHPADELNPRWSPDGSKIAFVSNRGTGAHVYWVPASGGAERKLAETGLHYLERFLTVIGSLGDLPWSPDGRQLLFPRLTATGETAIWRVSLETGEEVQITNPPAGTNDLAASWSFDGQSIVFQRNQDGRGNLWLMDAEGGEPRQLLGDQFNNAQPTWSSDNRRIVFVSNRAGHDNLWDLDLSSGKMRLLTTGPERIYYPSSSRNGPLAYSDFKHQTDLYVLDVNTGLEKRLTFHMEDNFDAAFSPDGQRVVYQSTRTGDHEIWLLDLASNDEINLTANPAIDIKPDWSPDGDQIVFLSNRDGEFNLWVVNADGSNVHRLSDQPGALPSNYWSYSQKVRWAPDGEAIGFIAQTEEGRALWTVDETGKNARVVLVGAYSFDWWQDSRHVIYNDVSANELRVADLVTGEEAVLYQGPLTEVFVSPDGRSVAFCHAAGHFSADLYQLRLRPPASSDGLPQPLGEPQRLTHGNGDWHVHNGAWSPDAGRIIYTRDKDEGDLYAITNYR